MRLSIARASKPILFILVSSSLMLGLVRSIAPFFRKLDQTEMTVNMFDVCLMLYRVW